MKRPPLNEFKTLLDIFHFVPCFILSTLHFLIPYILYSYQNSFPPFFIFENVYPSLPVFLVDVGNFYLSFKIWLIILFVFLFCIPSMPSKIILVDCTVFLILNLMIYI